jgi:HEPN domain-containing protein
MGKGIKMIDIGKQVHYWLEGSKEDWEVAQDLLKRDRIRHGLFLGHLALEKILKAHVVKATQELAPRTHNLIRLAELAGLNLSSDQIDIPAEMNAFNVEGRYPESLQPPPSIAEGEQYMERAKEVYEWLKNLI